ncbi:MAG TPA: hypothetical protein O0X60_00135, partial [Methanocorpusculum sp.]|nr:hypothetical protein [Methanocorpusculum sp.]
MKNTKIMAVLVVLLAAALFAGSVTATDMTNDKDFANITANVSTLTAAEGFVSEDIKIFNKTALTDTTKLDLYVDWGDGSIDDVTLAQRGGNEYNATVSHTYAEAGTYYVKLYNASTYTAGKTLAKPLVTITVVEAREVVNGDDVFVYEHIIYTTDTDATKLVKYSDGASPSVVNQISGTNGIFYLTEDVVGGQYGTYNVTGEAGNLGTVSIWYPEISLQAELTTNSVTGATSGDSIDGKTINKNTEISFLINSPKVQPALAGEEEEKQASAKIVFTTPSGGQTTYFGDSVSNNLGNIPLSGTQTIALGKGMTI